MIKIDIQEPNTSEWHAWLNACRKEQEAHNNAIEAGEESKVKEKIYKGKSFNIKSSYYMNLNGPFHGKCAYCESLIVADQTGDVEHFRPINAVTDADNSPIMVDTPNGPKPHPGYYWVAYDWHNLLPSCIACNRPQKSNNEGKLIGKWNRFPVKDFRAVNPGEEIREEPLLINPIHENPEDHLEIDETGIMKPKNESERGKACIDILGLNAREGLLEARKRCYDDTKARLIMLYMSYLSNNDKKIFNDIDEIFQGKYAYSSVARTVYRQLKSKLKLTLVTEDQLSG